MIFFLSQSNELLIQTFISPEQFSLRLQLIVSVLSFSSDSDEKDNSGTLKKKKKSDNINNDFSDCPTQIKSSDDNHSL
jgi:hypothetical protein